MVGLSRSLSFPLSSDSQLRSSPAFSEGNTLQPQRSDGVRARFPVVGDTQHGPAGSTAGVEPTGSRSGCTAGAEICNSPSIPIAADGAAALSAFSAEALAKGGQGVWADAFAKTSSVAWPIGPALSLVQYEQSNQGDSKPYKILVRTTHSANTVAGAAAIAKSFPRDPAAGEDAGRVSDVFWGIGSGLALTKSAVDGWGHLRDLGRRRDKKALYTLASDGFNALSAASNAVAAYLSFQGQGAAAEPGTAERDIQATWYPLLSAGCWLAGAGFNYLGHTCQKAGNPGNKALPARTDGSSATEEGIALLERPEVKEEHVPALRSTDQPWHRSGRETPSTIRRIQSDPGIHQRPKGSTQQPQE